MSDACNQACNPSVAVPMDLYHAPKVTGTAVIGTGDNAVKQAFGLEGTLWPHPRLVANHASLRAIHVYDVWK